MKSIILTFIFCLVATFSMASDWTGDDKKKHFIGSVPFGVVGGAVVEKYYPDWPWYYKIPAAFSIGMIPGVIKEVYDEAAYSGGDIEDIYADALGSLTGVGFYYTWRW